MEKDFGEISTKNKQTNKNIVPIFTEKRMCE